MVQDFDDDDEDDDIEDEELQNPLGIRQVIKSGEAIGVNTVAGDDLNDEADDEEEEVEELEEEEAAVKKQQKGSIFQQVIGNNSKDQSNPRSIKSAAKQPAQRPGGLQAAINRSTSKTRPSSSITN
jgi:hypothetical protein